MAGRRPESCRPWPGTRACDHVAFVSALQHALVPHPVEQNSSQVLGTRGGCVRCATTTTSLCAGRSLSTALPLCTGRSLLRSGYRSHADREDKGEATADKSTKLHGGPPSCGVSMPVRKDEVKAQHIGRTWRTTRLPLAGTGAAAPSLHPPDGLKCPDAFLSAQPAGRSLEPPRIVAPLTGHTCSGTVAPSAARRSTPLFIGRMTRPRTRNGRARLLQTFNLQSKSHARLRTISNSDAPACRSSGS